MFYSRSSSWPGSTARTVSTVIRSPSEMGAVWVPKGRQHLSAVVIGGIGKHILESVRLGEKQPNLFVAPVYRR